MQRDRGILDLFCGIGRHAIPLAKKGYSVVGIDFQERYLSCAEGTKRQAALSVFPVFVQCDLRNVDEFLNVVRPFGNFDCILRLYTSLGYLKDREWRLLNACSTIASSRCILILDTFNRDFFVENKPHEKPPSPIGHGVVLTERYRFLEEESGQLECVWVYKNALQNKVKEISFMLPLYTVEEVSMVLHENGWQLKECFSDLSLLPVGLTSERVLFVSVRR